MAQTIASAVGTGGSNLPVDVAKIQGLLGLAMNGVVDDALLAAIKTFQREQVGMNNPDGRVDPGGGTLARLNANAGPVFGSAAFNAASLQTPDCPRFAQLVALQYPSPALSTETRNALAQLLATIVADSPGMDLRWIAYMLATVKHECANRWIPLEEYGKGAGRDYGKPVSVAGPNGAPLQNVYYGRGYVQLTWDYNYKKMDQVLALADSENSMYWYPQKALEPDIAYRIMSYGMQHGTFTGKKLADYINAANADYTDARRIINGTDQAALIAGYAVNLEFLLRLVNT